MVHIFIINPYSGSQIFADDLREKLSHYNGLKYFVFNTRSKGNEAEFTRKILRFFDEDRVRLYCCGGTGTLKNMINGIDDLMSVEIAFFPCGFSNAFLKSFGRMEPMFYNLDNLIGGKAFPVDYIKTNNSIALNSFSAGYDQNVLSKVDEYRSLSIFGKNMPYWLGLAHGLLLSRSHRYVINADDRTFEDNCAQIVFMNGCSMGGNFTLDENADVFDGKGKYYICPNLGLGRMRAMLSVLTRSKYEKYGDFFVMGTSERFTIRRADGRQFQVDLDGELQPARDVWEAEIVHKGLNFVFPKGVIFDE